jgi:hypothetical protein
MAVVPGDIYLSHSQLVNARVAVAAESSAKIFYAKGSEGAQPYFGEDSALSLGHEDIVWIEVFSANLDSYLIYAIKVHNRTPLLSGLTLGYQYPNQTYSITHSHGLNLGTPGTSLDDSALVPGEIWYGKTQAGSTLTVTAQPEMSDSVVVVSGSTDFDSPAQVTAVNDSYFYIRSASVQEQGETIYYKIKLIQKNDDLSLAGNKVVINGVDATAGRMGAHSLVGQEAWGAFHDGAVLDADGSVNIGAQSAPVNVVVTLTDVAGVTVEYSHTSNDRDYLVDDENWSYSNNLGNLPTAEYVVLRLTSELGVQGWYKFRIGYGSSEAALTSVTVGEVSSTPVGTPGIFDQMLYGAYNGVPGTVTLTPSQAGDGSTVTVAAAASTGATVRYNWGGGMNFGFGMTYYLSGDANWNTTGAGLFAGGTAAGFITVPPGVNGAVVFIEVTSQDGTTVNTYAVSCAVGE